jgi:organic radical activating enzyme
MLEVCEIFYSVQGEGLNAGRPSLFLRLGGCNLSCPGFGVELVKNGQKLIGCDSIHAVNKTHFRSSWTHYKTPGTLIAAMEALVPNSRPFDIVLTGGEPTLYFHNPVLIETLEHFLSRGCEVTVETNATVEIDFDRFPVYKNCTFALAVKLANSGETAPRRINDKAIDAVAENARRAFFKFVLESGSLDESLREIEAIIRGRDIPVYCMPMGESNEMMAQNDKAVFEMCVQKGYCYSDRIHIRVWGKKGGV